MRIHVSIKMDFAALPCLLWMLSAAGLRVMFDLGMKLKAPLKIKRS